MKRATIILLLAGILLGSCTSLQVTSDSDSKVDFTQFQTFEYYGWEEESDQILSRFDKERIENAFGNEFAKRGLNLVKDEGDLVVTLYIVTETKTQKTSHTTHMGGMGGYGGYYSYGPGWGWGGGHSTTTYSEYDYEVGTLICSVYDKAKKQLIWESAGVGTVDDDPKTREVQIPKAVAKIMSEYPVEPAK